MKNIFWIISITLTANTSAIGQILNFNNIDIQDKEYFMCYSNPFNRMGNTTLAELNWEVGNYDADMILQEISAALFRPIEDSTEFIMFLVKGSYIVSSVSFTTVNNTLNEGVLLLKNKTFENLSCKLEGNYYFELTNEQLLMYFNENLIRRKLIFTMNLTN